MTNSDCGVGQCCNNYHGPLQVSRRRDLGSLLTGQLIQPEKQVGHCESYQSEGAHCSSIDVMNGHCGCDMSQGLSCQFHPPPTLQLFTIPELKLPTENKKRAINPIYGSYKCTKLLLS
ncbi:hypothetical protein KUTeg_004553 [Tegillarca granosa]|uniref:Uncharacterized protein n=1 Tax=Tegillarca granosa TaxID=220873 RepID=A0ABQ9FQA1_TEGGR|nr:hypothetical protein KUTeg_004553 [Tegillarca granosa]